MREEDNIMCRRFDAAVLRAGLVLGVVVLAAGCQPKYWYQQGRTFDECKTDFEECRTELHKLAILHHESSYPYRFLKNCMQQKGYERVAEKHLPFYVKREDPSQPSYIPWAPFYGVAGALSAPRPSVPPNSGSAQAVTLIPRDPDPGTNRLSR
jgi:hypothetical protein